MGPFIARVKAVRETGYQFGIVLDPWKRLYAEAWVNTQQSFKVLHGRMRRKVSTGFPGALLRVDEVNELVG